MRTFRPVVASLLILGLSTSAFAGDLAKSIAKAAQQEQTPSRKSGSSKALIYTGAGMFIGGMTVGLYAFINNQNGDFAEFGEANAVNKELGGCRPLRRVCRRGAGVPRPQSRREEHAGGDRCSRPDEGVQKDLVVTTW